MDWAGKMGSLLGVSDRLYEKVFEFASSVVQWEISLQLGLKDELEKLKRTQGRISALLRDAEERRVIEEEAVLGWLRDLKDVALDAEDVIDECETRLDFAVAGGGRKRPWYAVAAAPSPLILFRRRVATEIKEINERFDRVSKTREALRLRIEDAPIRGVRTAPPSSTAALLPGESPQVLGRDRDRDEILRLLVPAKREDAHKNNSNGLLVIPIFGMAGMGKSTLARCVFNNERVGGHFEENMIWICATEGFDVERITKEILESLTREACNLSNFNLIQCRVREHLIGKPFLLVLDDVRDEGPLYWDNFRVCLPAGGGGRVVITTRSEDVANRMGTNIPGWSGRLNGLSDADCLRLFEKRAFPNGGGLDRLSNLRDIGEQIAGRCQGSPLAAISLGGLLQNETEETEWICVLKETTEFSLANNDILPKLKLAYDHLPLHLKKCFAFCATFPDGYLFDRDVLVRMWIAEGFVERRGNRRLETMGSRFFDELLWRSFFQVSDRTQQQKVKHIIPSLFHDLLLAQSVSKHECFKMVDNKPVPHEISEHARHTLLLYHRGNTVEFTGFHKYKRLRTFTLKGDDGISIRKQQFGYFGIRKLPSDLFLKLRCLRVLDLSDSTVTELPDSIGELKLLRYLSLCNTWIEWLPESVATLCNLQTLDLNRCYKLRELPEGTSNLVSLRYLGLHLDLHKGSYITSMPPGIGKLTSLETLSRFIVGTRNGCGISEIKNLGLRGKLWISNLENVPGVEDATDASLHTKNDIKTLTLQWSDHDQRTVQHADRVDVIEHLRPPKQLKYLYVDNYGGLTVPNWLGDGYFSDLVSLRLSYCRNWNSLQKLEQLPTLKELFIEGMHSMKTLECPIPDTGGAPSFKILEKLTLLDFPALVELSLMEDVMPGLSELYIAHCPKLINVAHLPSSLTKLTIRNCQALSTLPTLPTLEDLIVEACESDLLGMVCNLACLKSLTISHVSRLKDMQESFLQHLTALKRLEISCCNDLETIEGKQHLQDFTSLEYLRISSCPKLSCILSNGLPAKLKNFSLCYCHKLTSVPWDLPNLTSLQHMEIREIPGIKSLPQGVSSTLQYLAISGCPLLSWRCRKDHGKDWQKIKDIFYIEIDYKVLSVNRGK